MTEIQFYITAVAAITYGLMLAICVYAIIRTVWVYRQRMKLLKENKKAYESLPSFNEMADGHGFWWWNIERYLPEKKEE